MNAVDLKYILSDHSIPSKNGSSPYEVAINCPRCRDTGFHMQLNPTRSSHGVTGWGFCYKGWHAMPLEFVLLRLGIKHKISDLPESPKTTFDRFEIDMGRVLSEEFFKSKESKIHSVDISQFHAVVPATNFAARGIKKYLNNRGISDSQIQQYQLMYAATGDLTQRVIIPFFEDFKPVYYQARTIFDNEDRKILNPPSGGWTLDGKSQYLYNFDQAKEYDPVVINEGWASAITTGPWAVSINGKVASERQLELLKQHWSSYVVMLDSDAHKEAYNLACELVHPGKSVRVVCLPEGDPNDYDFISLYRLISNSDVIRSTSEAKMAGMRQLLWIH